MSKVVLAFFCIMACLGCGDKLSSEEQIAKQLEIVGRPVQVDNSATLHGIVWRVDSIPGTSLARVLVKDERYDELRSVVVGSHTQWSMGQRVEVVVLNHARGFMNRYESFVTIRVTEE